MASLISPKFLKTALGSEKLGDSLFLCLETGKCTVNHFVLLLIAISQYALGILGAVALLFFIIGGFRIMFAGANSDQLAKGKNTLKGTVIAILIIFFAWIGVRFVLEKVIDIDPKLLTPLPAAKK